MNELKKLINSAEEMIKDGESPEKVLNALLTDLKAYEKFNGWIPCSERLPKNNKPVLCWVKSTTIASGETYIIGSCDNGFWFLKTYEIGTHSFPVKDYKVIEWQPLPEPCVEGGGDND